MMPLVVIGAIVAVGVAVVLLRALLSDEVGAPGDWALIRAGTFTMGSPSTETGHEEMERQREVTITRDFWMQKTEVTQEQWRSVMGNDPSRMKSCGSDCPVETVSWYEAVAYCNALSKREGLPECYELFGCSGSPGDRMVCSSASFLGLSCEGYRLPTEAEWEYAARAGDKRATYRGELDVTSCASSATLDPIAWHCGNSGVSYEGAGSCSDFGGSDNCGTHPVGTRAPNAWGLHDMLGNVYEWCHDWRQIDLPSAAVADPSGPATGAVRVLRGGAWPSEARDVRAATRYSERPGASHPGIGFRPVRLSP